MRYNFSNRRWNVDAGFFDLSNDFRIDTGYVTRTGITMVPLFVQYSMYPKSKFFQRIDTFWWSYHLLDKHSDLFETYNHLVLRLNMPRQSQVRFDAILGNEVFADQRFSLSGWRVRGYTQLLKQLYLEGGYRRSDRIYYDPQAPFQGKGNTADLFLLFQPFDQLSTSLGLSYYDFYRSERQRKGLRLHHLAQPHHLPGEPLPVLPRHPRVQPLLEEDQRRLPGLLHLHPGHRHLPRLRLGL